MACNLNRVYDKLKDIRTYLIKIGAKRRHGSILTKKLEEANILLSEYNTLIDDFSEECKLGQISKEELCLITNISTKFESLFEDVKSLCCETAIMETFNLKTALTLLPIMTDQENNTKQLIDGIDYYNTILSKQECKTNLIQFVLKSRLSQTAKLKMESNYTSVSALLLDMKSLLLPKKSATAIQCKLQNIRQNELSVSEYGKEITELFADLTVSQADGNSDHYAILRPLNEKMAIKRFSDGLRNRRLSTIIAARNFSSLQDAIQAAQDEEVSSSGDIMGMSNNNLPSRNYRGRVFTNQRGYNRGQPPQRGYMGPPRGHPGQQRGPGRGRGGYQQHRGGAYYQQRYPGNNSNYFGRPWNYDNGNHVNMMSDDSHNTPEEQREQSSETIQFFRE